MFCTNCGAEIPVKSRFCKFCGSDVTDCAVINDEEIIEIDKSLYSSGGKTFDFSVDTIVSVENSYYEYKVLSQKDVWFSGKFDPVLLEQAINAYAQQGWRLVSAATADIPGFGSSRQEFIVLLERKIK